MNTKSTLPPLNLVRELVGTYSAIAKVRPDDVFGDRKFAPIVWVRMKVCHVLAQECFSNAAIAKRLGLDRTSIYHMLSLPDSEAPPYSRDYELYRDKRVAGRPVRRRMLRGPVSVPVAAYLPTEITPVPLSRLMGGRA